MNSPTPADLAAALETVRKYHELPMDQRFFADVAAWTLARYVAANAGRLRVVRPLEWVDRDCFASHSITVFGRIEVWDPDLGWHWRLIADDGRVIFSHRCNSLADGKAKAEQWYRARLAAALEPLFGEGGK